MITLCTIYSMVRGIWLEPMPCQISQVSNSPHRFQSCRGGCPDSNPFLAVFMPTALLAMLTVTNDKVANGQSTDSKGLSPTSAHEIDW